MENKIPKENLAEIENMIETILDKREKIEARFRKLAIEYFRDDDFSFEAIVNFIDELAFKGYIILNKNKILSQGSIFGGD